MDHILARMDPASCRALASYHQALADQLLANAEVKERMERAEESRRASAHAAKAVALRVRRAVEAGHDPERAIALLARRSGVEEKQVRAWVAIIARRASGRARLRNLRIVRLAARGWSERRLAAQFRLDRTTINRIVRRMLAENPEEAEVLMRDPGTG